MLVTQAYDHDEALSLMRDQVKKHKGYARVLTQHVIETYDMFDQNSERKERKGTK